MENIQKNGDSAVTSTAGPMEKVPLSMDEMPHANITTPLENITQDTLEGVISQSLEEAVSNLDNFTSLTGNLDKCVENAGILQTQSADGTGSSKMESLRSQTLAKQLQTHLSRAFTQVANNVFSFLNFVQVTGKLEFNVDNDEVLQVSVSEVIKPLSFDHELLKETTTGQGCSSGGQQGSVSIKEEPCDTADSEEEDGAEGMDSWSHYTSNMKEEERYPPTQSDEEDVTWKPSQKASVFKKRKLPQRLSRPHKNKPRNKYFCDNCNFATANNQALKQHCKTCKPSEMSSSEKTNKLLEGKFKCDQCDYVTDHSGHFRDHSNRHKGIKPHECEKCKKLFTTADDLKRHNQMHDRKFECGICSLEFDDRDELKEHAKESHGKTGHLKFFNCEICNKNMANQEDLDRHIKEKHEHKCEICVETFQQASQLRRHREEEHPQENLTCNICGKISPTKSALRKHLHRHKEGNEFHCDICSKKFTAQSTLYHHKRGMHGGIKPYKCEQCDKAFSFHHSLKLHILKHKGVRPHKCELCGKTYLTNTHLKSHIQAVHGTTKRFKCMICNKAFPYENSLKMHMMLHTGDRPFLCGLCGKGFVNNSALKAHEGTHIEGKEFVCDICNKKYKTEMLLKAHKRRHTDDGSRFICDICGHTFMYKSNLEAHYSVHGNERKFNCETCGKSFKTYATLYSHKVVHQEESPHTCSVCAKAFKSKERKTAHEKRHSGLKPFQCDICGRCFPDKGGLSKHRKTVHTQGKRFACPVCNKGCSRADNLRVHMKVHGDPGLLNLPYESLMVKDQMYDNSLESPQTNFSKSSKTEVHPGQHSLPMDNTSPEPHSTLLAEHKAMSLVSQQSTSVLTTDTIRQLPEGTELRVTHPPGGSGQVELIGTSHLQAMISDQLGGHTGFMSTHPMSQAVWPLSAYMSKIDPYNHHDSSTS